MANIFGLTAAGITHLQANDGLQVDYVRMGSSIQDGITTVATINAMTANNVKTPITGVGSGAVENRSPANTVVSDARAGTDIVDPNNPTQISNTKFGFTDESTSAYTPREMGFFFHNPSDGNTFTNDIMVAYGVELISTQNLGTKVAVATTGWDLLLVAGSGGATTVLYSLRSSVPYATQTEADAGTITTKAINPARLKGYVDNRRATQNEAEAGTGTSELMTPERTKQYVDTRQGTATPLAEGTAAVGTSAKLAREDHVHPSAGGFTLLGTATIHDNRFVDVVSDSGFSASDLLLGIMVLTANNGLVTSGIFPYSVVNTTGRSVGYGDGYSLQTKKSDGQIQLKGEQLTGNRTFYLYKLG